MLSNLLNYKATDKHLWQGRKDSLPMERFFQHMQCIDIRSTSLGNKTCPVILGYCCDEGIRRNAGRLGSKEGPNELREQLAKLACHTHLKYLDIGNIVFEDNLENTQKEFAALVDHCHQKGFKTIAFGGGHDIAWAHYQGLAPHYSKIGIINFDAHFDIRPLLSDGQGTSGTPFWQIKQHTEHAQKYFDYSCVGIQSIANTRSLFEQADEWGVRFMTAEQIAMKPLAWQTAFLDKILHRNDAIYLSICLDVFAESFAPGVSAPQATGLSPWQALPLLKYIVQTGKVVSIDMAELSPPLDQERKTSRLGAAIIAELLNLNPGTPAF